MGKKYLDLIEPGCTYHVYNRAVGDDLLFNTENDYKFFLHLLKVNILPVAKILTYCLMPNHYHLVIRINDNLNEKDVKKVSQAFRKIGIQFVKSVNYKEGRKGTLFMRPFKRIKITNEFYLLQLILYIHLNPLGHNGRDLVMFSQYPWSSYADIINGKSELIDIELVISFFDDLENFQETHQLIFKKKLYSLSEDQEFGN